jgi:hypothetical protein
MEPPPGYASENSQQSDKRVNEPSARRNGPLENRFGRRIHALRLTLRWFHAFGGGM